MMSSNSPLTYVDPRVNAQTIKQCSFYLKSENTFEAGPYPYTIGHLNNARIVVEPAFLLFEPRTSERFKVRFRGEPSLWCLEISGQYSGDAPPSQIIEFPTLRQVIEAVAPFQTQIKKLEFTDLRLTTSSGNSFGREQLDELIRTQLSASYIQEIVLFNFIVEENGAAVEGGISNDSFLQCLLQIKSLRSIDVQSPHLSTLSTQTIRLLFSQQNLLKLYLPHFRLDDEHILTLADALTTNTNAGLRRCCINIGKKLTNPTACANAFTSMLQENESVVTFVLIGGEQADD